MSAIVGDPFGEGRDDTGIFLVLAGPPKLGGKTTFAAGAPNPAFILTDAGGLDGLPTSIKRRVPSSWPEVLDIARWFRDAQHGYKTVVLDTVFKAESMLIKHLCERGGKDTLKALGGGWGAGHELLQGEINKIVDIFFALNAKGINTIVISQVESRTVQDPSIDDYEKTALALSKRTATIWTAAAHVNMFAQPEMRERERIEQGKDREDRVKVEFTGRVICHVRPSAGIDAGNRFFLDSPMTYSWAALELGRAEGKELRDRLYAHLNTLSPQERAAADWSLNQSGWSKDSALRVIDGQILTPKGWTSNVNGNGKR